MAENHEIKVKIQILCAQEVAMGPGKANLLDAIRKHGSISAASRAMDMSYRRAWLLVDTMNRCWAQPLVQAFPGRARGSGAQVTPMGETVLAAYRDMEQRAARACSTNSAVDFAAHLRDAPLPRAVPAKPSADTI